MVGTSSSSVTTRSATLGTRPGLASCFSSEFSLELFRRASFIRAFELEVARARDAERFTIPIYLSVGQEFTAAALSMVLEGTPIFAQHRCHGLYLAFGGDPAALRDELLGLPTGCSGGMSGSNAIQAPSIQMFGHSGLMGEQVPIAVGAALASGRPVLTVCGDASVEEDYIYPAIGWAASRKLPVLFVCEDNGLSILTPKDVRRSWSAVDMARALGVPGVDITDDPWLTAEHAREMFESLPGFLNIQTVRHMWHAGTGVDGAPEWDRYAMVRAELVRLGFEKQLDAIEREEADRAREIWA